MSRYTAEQRRSILDQWHRSGLPAPDFAVACGVSVATLDKWRRGAAPAFVEVAEPHLWFTEVACHRTQGIGMCYPLGR